MRTPTPGASSGADTAPSVDTNNFFGDLGVAQFSHGNIPVIIVSGVTFVIF